jgi:GTP-binding protein Era
LLFAIYKADAAQPNFDLKGLANDIKTRLNVETPVHIISSKQGRGLSDLLNQAAQRLPEAPPYFPTDQVTDRWERFYAAELIREQIFLRYQDEVPHASLVQVEGFTEKPGHKDVIRATIIVETEGQKRIMIGEKGRAIRDLGQRARTEIEKQIGRPVFLELNVKVHPRWRKDSAFLKDLETHQQ